jgi:hypothetical protein
MFNHIVGFSAETFNPYLTSPFLIRLLDQHLIRRHNMVWVLQTILPQEVELGAHTNVVLIQEGSQLTFVWTHPVNRPWGHHVRPQCERCSVLKPWMIKWDNKDVVLSCRTCGNRHRFSKPRELVMSGDAEKSRDGLWGFIKQLLQPMN